jgi:hypothetical protein
MPIDGGARNKLEAGTVLVARYKGAEHRVEVVAGDDGKVRFRLADGREFKSPSAAGSAVMGGIACNGWRFWSPEAYAPAAPMKVTRTRKAKAATDAVETTEDQAATAEAAVE